MNYSELVSLIEDVIEDDAFARMEKESGNSAGAIDKWIAENLPNAKKMTRNPMKTMRRRATVYVADNYVIRVSHGDSSYHKWINAIDSIKTAETEKHFPKVYRHWEYGRGKTVTVMERLTEIWSDHEMADIMQRFVNPFGGTWKGALRDMEEVDPTLRQALKDVVNWTKTDFNLKTDFGFIQNFMVRRPGDEIVIVDPV